MFLKWSLLSIWHEVFQHSGSLRPKFLGQLHSNIFAYFWDEAFLAIGTKPYMFLEHGRSCFKMKLFKLMGWSLASFCNEVLRSSGSKAFNLLGRSPPSFWDEVFHVSKTNSSKLFGRIFTYFCDETFRGLLNFSSSSMLWDEVFQVFEIKLFGQGFPTF